MQFLIGFKVFLAHEFDDVIAERHEERFAHLVHLKGVGNILKLLHHLIGTDPRQHAASCGRPRVLRYLLGKLGEVGTVLQCLIDRVNPHFGCSLLFFRGILRQVNQDMRRLQELLAFESGQHSVVIRLVLILRCTFRHEQRTNLLVAICTELLLVA